LIFPFFFALALVYPPLCNRSRLWGYLKLKFGGSGGVFAAEKFALTLAFKWEQPLVWQRAPEGLKTNVRWW
jgi:hypothetical protein